MTDEQSRQGPDGAMYLLTGAHLAVAATSLGLGIATYVSHAGAPMFGRLPTLAVAPLGGGGVAVAAAGRF